MEPLHRRRRAIVLRFNAGKQSVRGRGAITHHAACLQSPAREDKHSLNATDTAGRPKSRQCCEEENNTGGEATKPAHSLLRSHNKSTYFPKLCNAAGVGAATPTRREECHTRSRSSAQLKPQIGATARRRSEEKAPVRTHRGRFHVQCRPCPVSPVIFQSRLIHALGGETAVGVWCGWAETRWQYVELWRPTSGKIGAS